MAFRALAVISVSIGACALACSGATSNGFAPGDGGSDDASSHDGHAGDGGSDGGAASDGGGDSAGAALYGYVEAISYSYTVSGQPVRGGSFGAGFTNASNIATCTISHVGPCDLYDCPIVADAGTPPQSSAGDVTLTGGTQNVSVSPGTNGGYTFENFTSVLWNGGETLTMHATGAEVPAFTGTVRAPTSATITVPAAPAAGQPIVIDRASALSLAWQGAAGTSVFVQLGRATSTDSIGLQCTFDGSAGSGNIPAAALQNVSAGTGGYFGAYVRGVSTVSAGAWGVQLIALSFALMPSGGPFSTQATFR